MLYSTWSLLLALESFAKATESYAPLTAPPRKRHLMTCDQTYGNGSIPCGGPESTWCFNPTLGQSCCQLDKGFCGSGSYCAPVAGYCCLQGEDLETCARNGGFDLPGPATSHITNPAPTVAPAGVSRTFEVTPFLAADMEPTVIFSADSDAETAPTLSAETLRGSVVAYSTSCHEVPFTLPVMIPTTNTSALVPTQPSKPVSPIVQVSRSVGHGRPLIDCIIMVVVASILTTI